MTALALGANTTLGSAQCSWTIECANTSAFGEYAAIALLPTDDKRHSKGEPALFHLEQPWMDWVGRPERPGCTLNLAALPAGADRLVLVVYTFSAAGPVSELRSLRLQLDGQVESHLDLSANGESAIIIGEFYSRNQAWKFRALAEGSAYGLSALGRRIGLEIDDAHPHRRSSPSDANRSRSSATGTGFAVTTTHILTCAHVIEDMQEIHVSSFEGRHRAEPVVVDRRNDLALLRVQNSPLLKPASFRDGARCDLGEPVVALGFPLAGLAGGGIHATQGGVSALFGLHNDASVLQFTAPIQPGSSGSPLFDTSGAVIGMVTSTVPDAQNMNFAVKAGLTLAFLNACGIQALRSDSDTTFTTAQITREAQHGLWKIEARNP
ncbi:trypsin-like peptidase domain-containing protein [Pseudomonas sp. Marseille-P9899]|uniref:trypsin-like peptidase domain-containing protein n=1 Tax=Pseudomonas sp. Marseille-P9899 TaxID=2730401 RepID=UPI00158E1E70|nr:trypsin-like peptidase domain-containing protein [Pseudomonas sp. Marseille-P9899]